MTQRSTVVFALRDGGATLPDASRLHLEEPTDIEARAGLGGPTTATFTAVEPAGLHAPRAFLELGRLPTEPASAAAPGDRLARRHPRAPSEPTVRLRARGSRPPPLQGAPWFAPEEPAASGSAPSQASPSQAAPAPRSSTAPPYSLVSGSRPRMSSPPFGPAPARSPALAGERPIAWGRVFVAVALMSALMGSAIARLAYHPRDAAVAAPAGVAVPFEHRAAAPALAP